MPKPVNRIDFLNKYDAGCKGYKMLNGTPFVINISGSYYFVEELAQAVKIKDLSLYDDFVRLLKSPKNNDHRATIWEII
jgi:hypothetical protein